MDIDGEGLNLKGKAGTFLIFPNEINKQNPNI